MIGRTVLLAVAAAWTTPLVGQTTQEAATEAILRALNLPAIAEAARTEGVGDSVLREVLTAMKDRDFPADEAEMALEGEVEAVRAGGPTDNFGAFVRQNLDAGLRGRDLAQAIRAEHRARGIGIPERPGRPERDMRGGPPNRGRPAEVEQPEGRENLERQRPERGAGGRDSTRTRGRN